MQILSLKCIETRGGRGRSRSFLCQDEYRISTSSDRVMVLITSNLMIGCSEREIVLTVTFRSSPDTIPFMRPAPSPLLPWPDRESDDSNDGSTWSKASEGWT